MPAVAKAPPDQAKPKKKKKTRKIKPRVLKLKGWLKTPEDWAKFDAWVKVNALPRKLPEPEPVIRSKAVSIRRLKKRLKNLAKPAVRPVIECGAQGVSCEARYATASRRVKELAFPKIRITGPCNEGNVSRAALKYKASENMLYLAQPKIRPIVGCKPLGEVSRAALKRKCTEKDDRLARPLKRRRMSDQCEEMERKCEEGGELSSWMEFLAIPSYRRLMDQDTEQAIVWREQIIEELEPRGKQAYEEQMKKLKEQRRREAKEEKVRQEEQKRRDEERKRAELEEKKSLRSLRSKKSMMSQKVRLICEKGDEENEEIECEEEPQFEDALVDEPAAEEDVKSKSVEIGETEGDESEEGNEEEEEEEEDEEAKNRRKMEKNAWRFDAACGGCKPFPPVITEAAKNAQASPRVESLAQPKKPRDSTCKDPYEISEGAKSAQASPWVVALAKPKYTSEPKCRPPPPEYDEFGRPIYPKPPFGKVLPEPEPYVGPECKTEEEKEEERKEKEEQLKKEREKRPIDKIAYEPTIDPMFDPRGYKRQMKERARAAQLEKEKAGEGVEGEGEEDGEVA